MFIRGVNCQTEDSSCVDPHIHRLHWSVDYHKEASQGCRYRSLIQSTLTSRSLLVIRTLRLSAIRKTGLLFLSWIKYMRLAKSHGIQKIELDYWADNQMASDFYGKHGFAKYSEFVYKDLI
jgi:hypothetical protein